MNCPRCNKEAVQSVSQRVFLCKNDDCEIKSFFDDDQE